VVEDDEAFDEDALDEVVSDEEGGGVAMLIGPSRLNIRDPFLLTNCLETAFDKYMTLYGSCIEHDGGVLGCWRYEDWEWPEDAGCGTIQAIHKRRRHHNRPVEEIAGKEVCL
jgi:hypothetical protein